MVSALGNFPVSCGLYSFSFRSGVNLHRLLRLRNYSGILLSKMTLIFVFLVGSPSLEWVPRPSSRLPFYGSKIILDKIFDFGKKVSTDWRSGLLFPQITGKSHHEASRTSRGITDITLLFPRQLNKVLTVIPRIGQVFCISFLCDILIYNWFM